MVPHFATRPGGASETWSGALVWSEESASLAEESGTSSSWRSKKMPSSHSSCCETVRGAEIAAAELPMGFEKAPPLDDW